MEAPLALHGDAEAEQPAEPQPLPRELREKLRRLMLLGTVGPLAPAAREAQRRRAQAVAGCFAAWYWLLAPFVLFRAIPDEALLVRWACVALLVSVGLLVTFGSNLYTLWRDVLPGVLEQLEAPVGA